MRLTAHIRTSIANACVQDLFGETQEALKQERQAFALRLYRRVVSEEMEQHLTASGQYPRGYFYVNVRRDTTQRERQLYIELCGAERPFPKTTCIVVDPNLEDEWTALYNKDRSLQANMNTMRRKVLELTKSVTTDKRLKEVWPAGAKYIPAEVPATSSGSAAADLASEVTNLMCDFGAEVEA